MAPKQLNPLSAPQPQLRNFRTYASDMQSLNPSLACRDRDGAIRHRRNLDLSGSKHKRSATTRIGHRLKGWALGCVNPDSRLPLAAGGGRFHAT